MHSSTPLSSSYPTSRSISGDSNSEISVATARQTASALELQQEIPRTASFHSPRHFEQKGSSPFQDTQLHEPLRSDMPNMTVSTTSSHSDLSARATRNTTWGLEVEPRQRTDSTEPQLHSSDDLSSYSRRKGDGGLKIIMQPPTPHSEENQGASSSNASPSQALGKLQPARLNGSRSRSPKDSPGLSRKPRSQSPQAGTPTTVWSTAAQTLSTESSVHAGSHPLIRSESPIYPLPTSPTTPPRSPVLSPRPTTLLPGSSSPVRDRSPSRRIGSPLAQSISPLPGYMTESGNGILSPRLSPIPSPMASPGTEISNPLSPRSSNSSLPARVDEMDYSTEASSVGEEDYFQNGSSESTPTGSSPQQPYNPQTAVVQDPARSPGPLHISVPDRDPEIDDNSMQEGEMPMLDEDQQQAMFLDDEGLTALEKIYLFSRSTFPWHRSYISKQLPYLIRDVPPTEAVDYVCPLLNGLGTDPEESVKEVFVQELVPIIWWFFTQCQLYDHQLPEPPPMEDVTYLPADAFTPLIGSLLLSANPRVGDGARLAIVDLINRLQTPQATTPDDRFCEPFPSIRFGDAEKTIIMNEIMNGVVLGMGRLDTEFQDGANGNQDSDQRAYAREETPRSGAPSPEDMAVVLGGQVDHSSDADRFVYSPQEDEMMDHAPAAEPEDSDQGFYGTFVRMPGQAMDEDGWISSLPRTPDEEILQLGTSLEPQLLGTIEEEPASNDTGDEATVGRVASMSVVAAIAANATMPLNMQEVFVQEVWRVGSDSVYWVRREASFAIGALAKVVPLEMVSNYLLPLYKSLVKDEQWHVRHSILFALPGILARVDAVQRRSLTVPSLVHLSLDPSDPVRSGLLEVLGEVIYTFRDDPEGPPRELLQLFIQDRDWSRDERSSPAPSHQSFHSVIDWFSDPERPIICAFNFPAVIFTIGAKRWPEVRNYYLHLAKFPTAKVLRTLAASLGEVATIIGPENAEVDLIPIFLNSLRSTEPEVRSKIIEALPKFVVSLSESKREWIAAEICSVWLDLGGWREREDLARLLGELVSLAGGRVDSVVEMMSKALQDEVAAVREAAISSIPKYLKALQGTGSFAEAVQDIQSLSSGDKYRHRVTFVSCALSMVQAAKTTSELEALKIWDSVTRLASDPIVDVRIGVARLVANATGESILEEMGYLFTTTIERLYPRNAHRGELMKTLLRSLANDEAPQVRAFVSFLLDKDVTTPQGSSFNESGFAIFSKPPRTTNQPLNDDVSRSIDNQIDDIAAAVAEKMDLDPVRWPVPSIVTNSSSDFSGEYSPGRTGMLVPSPSTLYPSESLPSMANTDTTGTIGNGTSHGEESQPSPKATEGESPRHRAGKSRRNHNMTLGDLPQGIELTEAYQAPGMLTATRSTPSPGSERRISFDGSGNHSDGSDSSSGRIDPMQIPRRATLHGISSDPAVSVASG